MAEKNLLLKYMLSQYDAKRGEKLRSGIRIKEKNGVMYVYDYVPKKKLIFAKDMKRRLTAASQKMMSGDRRASDWVFTVYYDLIVQFLRKHKELSDSRIQIIPVPRAEADAANPLDDICLELSEHEYVRGNKLYFERNALKREVSVPQARKGRARTPEGVLRSLKAVEPLKADTVFLLDDMVNTGMTVKACKKLLKEAGAKNIYVFSLMMYNRGDK